MKNTRLETNAILIEVNKGDDRVLNSFKFFHFTHLLVLLSIDFFSDHLNLCSVVCFNSLLYKDDFNETQRNNKVPILLDFSKHKT